MSKLDDGQMHLMRLIVKGADAEKWAPVSCVVWPLIAKLPSDLVEMRGSEVDGGHARLTPNGEAVVFYS